MMAREQAGSPAGLFVSAKGGSNNESHNHNDVGSLLVCADGRPLLIDIGTEDYNAKRFSSQRYDLWYTQSQYHNCPGVGGALQHEGREYRAENMIYN